jgi:hypothetical protein
VEAKTRTENDSRNGELNERTWYLFLNPFVRRHSKFLHRMNDRFASIRRKQVNDFLVNGGVHKLELIPGLGSLRGELDFNNSAVFSANALLCNLLADQSFDDSCETAARQTQTPSQLARRDLLTVTDTAQKFELRDSQVQLASSALNLDLTVLKKLVGEIRHLLGKLVLLGHRFLHE